jgi:hypothetical protein
MPVATLIIAIGAKIVVLRVKARTHIATPLVRLADVRYDSDSRQILWRSKMTRCANAGSHNPNLSIGTRQPGVA